MTFAQNLKYLRDINDITQDQLAAHLKVTRSTIAGYETKGKQPDYDKLCKIATFFQVSVDFLIKGVEDEEYCIPDYIVTKRISEHEFTNAYRKLSRSSRQKLWEYMELLQLAEKQEQIDETGEK